MNRRPCASILLGLLLLSISMLDTGCGSSLDVDIDAESILPVSDVRRVLGDDDIVSVKEGPVIPGIYNRYQNGSFAPVILLVSKMAATYPTYKEGSENIRQIDGLGKDGFVTSYKIETDLAELNSDERVVAFIAGKDYFVEVKSISRHGDSGHMATEDQLVELARIVDKNLTNGQ